jgi:6-phosphofructokinase 1
VPGQVEEVCEHLRQRRTRGKDSSIIVVAEGAKVEGIEPREAIVDKRDAFGHVRLDTREIGHALGAAIERITGFETRVTVLGHIQRGGCPSVFDRMLATRLGVAAVEYVCQGRWGHMPGLQSNRIVPVPLDEVLQGTRGVDLELYELARIFY